MGRAFDEALSVRERFLRVRGPVSWRFETRSARAVAEQQRSHARRLAESTEHAALREIALAIVDGRRVLEQESIQTAVIRDLPTSLGRVRSDPGAGSAPG